MYKRNKLVIYQPSRRNSSDLDPLLRSLPDSFNSSASHRFSLSTSGFAVPSFSSLIPTTYSNISIASSHLHNRFKKIYHTIHTENTPHVENKIWRLKFQIIYICSQFGFCFISKGLKVNIFNFLTFYILLTSGQKVFVGHVT